VKVLLLNAGSSSLKSSLLDSENLSVLASSAVEVAAGGYGAAARRAIESLPERPDAVGHRVVHGGGLTAAARIDDRVRNLLGALADVAPLHNPPSLETIAAAQRLLPDVPHVATFDTAFHSTMPAAATTFPIPYEWTRDWTIRRYGFHGLSFEYSARRAPELLGHPIERLVVCHLGQGCSAAAILRGRSVDTTMGFTPLDGLMMATRGGAIDPGVITYVERRHNLSAADVDDALNHRAGLLGVSGVSADMREVLAAARTGNERAELAVGIYVRRVRQTIGAFTATLGGLDALVFTAGVGEHSAEIRESVCRGLGCLGVELDDDANTHCRPDTDIAAAGSHARVLVIAAREDLSMLAEVLRAL
jgi:acetate kinase